jgi:hypothetical protein
MGVPTGAYIGAAPPGNVLGPLWWDSNSGQLFIQYNDGSSTQWVSANSIDASTLEGSFLPLTGGTVHGPVTLAGPAATLPGSAIQALHDALPASGGMIMLQANTTYDITATIVINKPNVTLTAPSWNTILKRNAAFASGPVLTAYGPAASHFTIEDFTIDGNSVYQTVCFDLEFGGDYSIARHMQILNSNGKGGIAMAGVHSRATGNTVMGTGIPPGTEQGDGIFACFQTTCMVDHNTIWGFGTSAIMIDGDGSQCIGNRVWGNHTFPGNPGGQIGTFPLSSDPGGGRGVCIVGNTVGPGGGANAHGIEVGGVDVLVSGNVVDTVQGYGMIVISDGVTITGNRIRNSPATDTAVDGITIFPNVSDFTITGNTIVDNRATPIMRTGIWVQAGTSDRYTIVGNTITGATFHPIFDGGTGDVKLISGNNSVESEQINVVAAATIQFPINPVIGLLGTTAVTAITTTNDARNRVVTLIPQAAMSFVAGSTIANSMTAIPGVPITGVFDGTRWHFSTMQAVPTGSVTLPVMDGTATIGTALTWAHADHAHPSDTTLLSLTAGGTVSGNLTLSSGTLAMTNATSNTINLSNHGFAPPSTTTRSIGTKIVLYDALTGSAPDFAIGIKSDGMWFAQPGGNFFTWYSGTTSLATLNNAGTMQLIGGLVTSAGIGVWSAPSPPASKPVVTGSKGANAALASLLTALAAYGLVTDSST